MSVPIPDEAKKAAVWHQEEAARLYERASKWRDRGMPISARHFQMRAANESYVARWLMRIEE